MVTTIDGVIVPVSRYEGTYEVNVLVSGRDITGTAAFRPAPSRKKKELTARVASDGHEPRLSH